MSKKGNKKSKSNETSIQKIALATSIINLLISIVNLINKLID